VGRRGALRRACERKGRRAEAFAPSFAFAGVGPGATDSGAVRAGRGTNENFRVSNGQPAWLGEVVCPADEQSEKNC